MAKILVADDEAGLREYLRDALELDKHEVTTAPDGEAAATLAAQRNFDVVITDLKMPKLDGMSLLQKLRTEQPELQVIVMTAHGSVDSAIDAMKFGAFDYLQKPLSSPDELSVLVARAVEKKQLLNAKARNETSDDAGDIPISHGATAMVPVVDAIGKVAKTPATVLILGESGTGKEVAAREIHRRSSRSGQPFMAINCAALSEQLLESELFGHEKGAFTGANQRRRGRIELCDGGTFFLDEIGELKLELQAKLLRVLQERCFERVGGSQTIEVDVRWVAATNRDLQKMISKGTFREDLYHRIAVFPIRLPPLRDRSEDILPIAEVLLASIAASLHRGPIELAAATRQRLQEWSWPGNVRELRNVLERAAILADGGAIEVDHLWLEAPQETTNDTWPDALADVERLAIERALRKTDGNRRKAASLLGIGERTLYDKIKRLEL